MPFIPNAEIVTVELLKSGLAPFTNIATSLPSPEQVQGDGFITVQAIGGSTDTETHLNISTIQLDSWGYAENTNKLPWAKTFHNAMRVTQLIMDTQNLLVVTPQTYNNALVRYVDITTDFRRAADSVYARYTGDIVVYWTPVTAEEQS